MEGLQRSGRLLAFIGGAKDSLFEICRCLRRIRALRCTDLGFWSSTPCSAPKGAGGGLTSPRGITAARPPFFILRVVARPLGFIDIGDLKRLRCLLEPCFEFFIFPKTTAGPNASEKPCGRMLSIFFIFPKTAAEPGASEKPCGRLGRLLGALGRVLSPLGRLLRYLEALLELPGALLRASWGS